MIRLLNLFTILILWTHFAFAQTNYGARLTAIGNCGASVEDTWGVAANPAAIANISSPIIQLSHEQHIFSDEIRTQALALVVPSKTFVFGVNVQRYGMSAFYTNRIGFIITKSFGPKLAIGLRGNYHQIKINNYGTTIGISIDVGTIYQLTKELSLGLYINNPSKETFRTKAMYTSLPTTAFFGISYQASEKLLIATNISQNAVATGIDYQLINAFSLRFGVSLNPLIHYFGLGFKSEKFSADFACLKHPNFGYSPQLTIGYVF